MIIDDVKKYIDLRLEHLRLSFAEKTSLLIGKIVLVGAVGLFILILVFLLMLLVYNLLMQWIGISWVVTLIEMGIVGVLIGVLWGLRYKLIIRPIANMIIKVLLYDSTNDKLIKDIEKNNPEKS